MAPRLSVAEEFARNVRFCTAFYGSGGTVFGLYYRLSPPIDEETAVVSSIVLSFMVILGLHAIYGEKGLPSLASLSFAKYLVVSVAIYLPLLFAGLYVAESLGLVALFRWFVGSVQ